MSKYWFLLTANVFGWKEKITDGQEIEEDETISGFLVSTWLEEKC